MAKDKIKEKRKAGVWESSPSSMPGSYSTSTFSTTFTTKAPPPPSSTYYYTRVTNKIIFISLHKICIYPTLFSIY